MNNKDQTRVENLTSALYKRDREVGEACKLMREFDSLLSTALDALRNIKGATPKDDARKQVIQERAETVVEQCRKYLDDHSNPF